MAKEKREKAEARYTGKEPEQADMQNIIGLAIAAMNAEEKEIPREYQCLARSTYIGYQVEQELLKRGYISTRPPLQEA